MKYMIFKKYTMPESQHGYCERIRVVILNSGRIEVLYSHCGNGNGCFWTDPEDITSYREFYGKGINEVVTNLVKWGFTFVQERKC